MWTPGEEGTGVIEVRNAEGLGGFLGAMGKFRPLGRLYPALRVGFTHADNGSDVGMRSMPLAVDVCGGPQAGAVSEPEVPGAEVECEGRREWRSTRRS